MKTKALAPWFGAKQNLAPQIIAELGDHKSYWEPFCGSMAVLLAKPECSKGETVNDMHGDLINLARVVQDAKMGPAFYRRMRRAWPSETAFREAKARLAEPFAEGMGRACDYFYCSWVGRTGVAGGRGAAGGFSVNWAQISKGGYLDRAVSSIPAWRRRMRRVVVLNRDALGVIENIRDEDGTAIYVDPPYIAEGGEYQHNLDPEQHRRLAELLGRFRRARVVVSHYEHPLLDELYSPSRWTRADNWVTRGTSTANGVTGSEKRNDLLIINGPSYTREVSLYAPQISEETI